MWTRRTGGGGTSTLPRERFLNCVKTPNRRYVNLVSKNVFFVYLGHGIIHRDAT